MSTCSTTPARRACGRTSEPRTPSPAVGSATEATPSGSRRAAGPNSTARIVKVHETVAHPGATSSAVAPAPQTASTITSPCLAQKTCRRRALMPVVPLVSRSTSPPPQVVHARRACHVGSSIGGQDRAPQGPETCPLPCRAARIDRSRLSRMPQQSAVADLRQGIRCAPGTPKDRRCCFPSPTSNNTACRTPLASRPAGRVANCWGRVNTCAPPNGGADRPEGAVMPCEWDGRGAGPSPVRQQGRTRSGRRWTRRLTSHHARSGPVRARLKSPRPPPPAGLGPDILLFHRNTPDTARW